MDEQTTNTTNPTQQPEPNLAPALTINLALTLDETNMVLAALGEQKYATVAQLIERIRNQGLPQVEKYAAENPQVAQQPQA
jgi:hypothetical protein